MAAHLAYCCAFSYATKDNDYANLWATTALKTLDVALTRTDNDTKPLPRLSDLQQDFSKFTENRIGSFAWLKPQVKQSWQQFWQQLEHQFTH